MSISGGELGFDEGGVLQALSKPFYQRSTIERKYNRKGLMVEETTHKFDVSMADVITLGIMAGVVTLGIFSTKAISDLAKDLPGGLPGTPENAKKLSTLFGALWGALKNQAGL